MGFAISIATLNKTSPIVSTDLSTAFLLKSLLNRIKHDSISASCRIFNCSFLHRVLVIDRAPTMLDIWWQIRAAFGVEYGRWVSFAYAARICNFLECERVDPHQFSTALYAYDLLDQTFVGDEAYAIMRSL